jgi:hypothetical protein
MSGLRYGKILLVHHPGAPGTRIVGGAIRFLFKYMHPLFDNGIVHVIEAPARGGVPPDQVDTHALDSSKRSTRMVIPQPSVNETLATLGIAT